MRTDAGATVVPDASGAYDIVLVAVRRDQLASAVDSASGPGPASVGLPWCERRVRSTGSRPGLRFG